MINLLIALSVGCSWFLAWLSYYKNRKSLSNKSFSALAFCIGLWAAGFIFYNNPPFLDSLFWIKVIYVNAILMVIALFYFSYAFPNGEKPKTSWLVLYFLLNLTIMYTLFFTNFFVKEVVQESYGPDTKLGFLYPYQIPIWISYLSWALYRLIRNCVRSHGVVRQQFLYIFLGMGIFMTLIVIFDGVIPIVFNTSYFFSLSGVASLFFVSTTAYAIIRHRMMDIRLIIARTVAYSLLLSLVTLFFVTASFLIMSSLLGIEVTTLQRVVTIAITLVIAVSFNRLKTTVERLTDKVLYQGHYDTAVLLSELGAIMSTHIELYPLTRMVLNTLVTQMRARRGAFILLDGQMVYDVISVGYEGEVKFSYSQVIPFLTSRDIFVYDELPEGDVKAVMRGTGIAVSKELQVEDKTIGLLLLGEKSSGDVYSDQDLKLITILGSQIAVAIQNSQAYDKIKQFNITLSEEVKKATNDLQIANAKLKEMDKLKDDFVSVASHELRTPMTAIRSYAWMALNRSDVPLSDKMKKYLSRVLISTERLINLVNDMLNISRLESGRIEFLPKKFSVVQEINEVITEVGPKIQEKQINLQIHPAQTPDVFADPDKVHQILLNLVGNALKFTPAKGTIAITTFCDGINVDISVKDTGVGISKEDMSRLFSKFGRLNNSYVAAATSGGTGLGLYISKMFVEGMGGKIWVASEGRGKGTTFTFSLPVATKNTEQQASVYTRKVPADQVKHLEPVAI